MRSNSPMRMFRTGASAVCSVTLRSPSAVTMTTVRPSTCFSRSLTLTAMTSTMPSSTASSRRVRLCFQHGRFQRFGGPAAHLGDGADHRGGVLEHLVFQRLVQVFALSSDRTRRADIRAGRHRCYVRRRSDECPGGRGVRSLRRDVDDHRHGRGQQGLRDVPRCTEQAAGRIERDDDGLGPAALRLLQRARDVAVGDGADDAVHLDHVRVARLDLGQRHACHASRDEQGAHRKPRDSQPRKERWARAGAGCGRTRHRKASALIVRLPAFPLCGACQLTLK